MKGLKIIIALLAVFAAMPVVAGSIPQSVGGFVLGQDVAEYQDRLQMDSLLPLRYREYLKELEIKPLAGYKSGLITYGTCAQPGRVVRVKLKYANPSRAFYNALLKRVKQHFGEPTKYEGDPFHIVIEWKWSFIDSDGRRITLHLSHNSRDTEEKFGNSVKLTFASALAEERQCFKKQNPQGTPSETGQQASVKSMAEEDWKAFVPQ